MCLLAYSRKVCHDDISGAYKENEITTEGSDRFREPKSSQNIVDPEHATWHAAKTLGAIIAFHISVIWLSHKLHYAYYSKYSQRRLRWHYLKG